MKTKSVKKSLSLILCMVLIVAMALFTNGCKESTSDVAAETEVSLEGGEIGEGSTAFDFTVVDKDGNETAFTVHTDKEIVGEALQELGLVEGEEGDYGLFVKKVNGITADYDVDGTYWAFYINGEYAMSGVDVTPIAEGESYSLKAEK